MYGPWWDDDWDEDEDWWDDDQQEVSNMKSIKDVIRERMAIGKKQCNT